MKPLPRTLISGYYGAGNLGDEALLAGLLRGWGSDLRSVRVASLTPGATAALHGVAAVHRLRGLPIALLRSEVVISGGGGLLQDRTSARSLYYYLSVLRAAQALGKRTIVYGQSLGPLSDRGAAAVARTLRGVPLALRDAPSLALAEHLGLEAVAVADAALLLDPPAAPSATADDVVVLIPRGGYPAMSETLARIGAAHSQQGGRLRLLLLHPDADRGEGASLAERLPGCEVHEPRDPNLALALMAGCRAVISGRLHGLILAAVAGIPTAGVAYDPKVAGFAADLRAPVVAADTPSDALLPFLAAPTLDAAARERLRLRAAAGLQWLQAQLTTT